MEEKGKKKPQGVTECFLHFGVGGGHQEFPSSENSKENNTGGKKERDTYGGGEGQKNTSTILI